MDYRECRYSAQDGLSLYFRDYGDPASRKTPVLCLGGFTRNSKDYDLFARRIAGERRVICPDLRGRGRSDYDPDWRNYQPRTYLNDIAHLLTIANAHHVIVVGTSLGGALAMGLSALLPSALAGVVLNDFGPEVQRGGLENILSYISVDRPQPDWGAAKTALKSLLPDLVFQTEEMFDAMLHNTFREGEDGMLHFDWDVGIVKPTLKAGGEVPDLWPFYKGLSGVPLLAFRGEKSGLISAETHARMGEAHPHATLVTVGETGHAPTLTEPECVAALDAFLGAH